MVKGFPVVVVDIGVASEEGRGGPHWHADTLLVRWLVEELILVVLVTWENTDTQNVIKYLLLLYIFLNTILVVYVIFFIYNTLTVQFMEKEIAKKDDWPPCQLRLEMMWDIAVVYFNSHILNMNVLFFL